MKLMHNHFVQCDRCYEMNNLKPVIKTSLGIKDNKSFHIVVRAAIGFWNGLMYRMPLCCNLFFAKERLKGSGSIARTVSLRRGETKWKRVGSKNLNLETK